MENYFEDDFDIYDVNLSIDQAETSEDTVNPSYLACLQKSFGYTHFRPMQWKIISSIIEHNQDTLAVMATGYGKSLCFQFPSVYLNAVTLVVSPLISLMEDQVLSLTVSNIKACLLGSAQKDKSMYHSVLDGNYRLVYLSPELLNSDLGTTLLKSLEEKLALVAIDEAHCISSWGHDFRMAFRSLGLIRRTVPRVPILAVTATATKRVQQDIVKSLGMRNAQIFSTGFDRPNLQFNVQLRGNIGIWGDIGNLVKSTGRGSTIIYCLTRKQTEDVANALKARGINCEAYHAGLALNKRKEILENFVRDKVHVIAATIAFGMGIDKPDVRLVIHYGASKNIESYYQEVGRAGRDGLPAKCHMFYSHSDFQVHAGLRTSTSSAINNNLEALSMKMREYINTTECRRQFILRYFEDDRKKMFTKSLCCDNCFRSSKTVNDVLNYVGVDEEGRYDFSEDAKILLSSIDVFGGYSGLATPLLFLRGSKHKKICPKLYDNEWYGKGKSKPEVWWKTLANLMEETGFLQRKNVSSGYSQFSRMQTVSLTPKARDWLLNASNQPLLLKVPKDMFFHLKLRKPEPLKAGNMPSCSSTNTSQAVKSRPIDEKIEIVKALLRLRGSLASQLDIMPYMVCSNKAIHQMAQLKPSNVTELKTGKFDGLSDVKIAKFGPKFIDSILQVKKYLQAPLSDSNNAGGLQEFLQMHPVPDLKISPTIMEALSLWKSGNTIKQIAQLRGLTEGTVTSYIVKLIKGGFLTKTDIRKLGVDDDKFAVIVSKLPVDVPLDLKLKPIKEKCPDSIRWEQLNFVVAYCQLDFHVRSHGGDLVKLQQEERNDSGIEGANHESKLQQEKQNECDLVVAIHKPEEGDMDEKAFAESFFDSDSDIDFAQIEIPTSSKQTDVQKQITPKERAHETRPTYNEGDFFENNDSMDRALCEVTETEGSTIVLDSPKEQREELDDLIEAIKREEEGDGENNKNDSQSSTGSDDKRILKRTYTERKCITFEDNGSSSDEENIPGSNAQLKPSAVGNSWLCKGGGSRVSENTKLQKKCKFSAL